MIDTWDYFKVDSKWNGIELDKQMSILEKYYPVGDYFYDVDEKRLADEIAFGKGDMPLEHNEYYKIIDYIIHNSPSAIHNHSGNKWYIIEYHTYDSKTHDLVRKNDTETRHPGFFYPAVKLNRTNKLNKLIE